MSDGIGSLDVNGALLFLGLHLPRVEVESIFRFSSVSVPPSMVLVLKMLLTRASRSRRSATWERGELKNRSCASVTR